MHLGATVIGTTSSQDKAEIVKQHGAHHVIVVPRDSPSSTPEQNSFIVKEVLRITKNEGVHGVFDGVGKDTFDDNFILTRRKGTIVSLGNASGAVPPFAPLKLGAKNLKLVRPRYVLFVTRARSKPMTDSALQTRQLHIHPRGNILVFKQAFRAHCLRSGEGEHI